MLLLLYVLFMLCCSLLLLLTSVTSSMLLAIFALPALLTLLLFLLGSSIGRSGAALLSLLLHLCSTLFAALLCYEALIAQLPSLLLSGRDDPFHFTALYLYGSPSSAPLYALTAAFLY